MRRFLHRALPAEGGFEIAGDEAHHLARVLRARPGDEVQVFDGAGREVVARIETVDRRSVLLTIIAETEPTRAARRVMLWTALPKGERLGWLIEKATECGVHAVLPTVFERSVRRELSENGLRRARRTAAEAAKQCGRADVPDVAVPAALAERLADHAAATLVLLSPGVAPLPVFAAQGPDDLVLVVGPAGGLTDEERAALLAAGAAEVSLGPFVLRTETAAVVAVHAAVAAVVTGGNGATT